MFKMIPQNNSFYEFFDKGAGLMVSTAEAFRTMLKEPGKAHEHSKIVEAMEHECDEVTHEAMALLHKSFITPLERGEIRRLVEAIDDVVDLIDDAALRIRLYEVTEILPAAHELADVLVDVTKVARKAIEEVRIVSKKNSILEYCIEMNRLEGKADRIHHRAQAGLFKTETDPLIIMKWREILVDIEQAIDRCEDLANQLEGIVLENA